MLANSALANLHQRRLDEMLLARSAHPALAAAAALDYCVENRVAPPSWVVEDAALALRELLLREKPPVRGRAGGLVARYRQDQIDFERWDGVLQARENQKRVAERVRVLEKHPDFKAKNPRHVEHELKLLAWLGKDWDRAYEVAAMCLLGRDAFAGPEAVKASYKRVQKRQKSGEDVGKYVRFHDEFLLKLGLEHPTWHRRGIKFLPIYNLTLPR
jgi:hypothetical protein